MKFQVQLKPFRIAIPALVFAASVAPCNAVAQSDVAGAAQGDATPQRDRANREVALEQRFAAADKDHDGKLTLDEAKGGMPLIAKNFDRIDDTKKGYLTLDDIKAATSRMDQ